MVCESVEHCLEALKVVLWRLRVDDHVVQVDQTEGQIQLPQTVLHEALKGGRGVAESVRHP